jgi:hypothetical protein
MRTPLEDTLIRVAFNTHKPVLRREILAVLKLADYPQEYIDWLQAKGAIFDNPSTGNKVKFLSLDSHSQAVVAEKLRPQYEKETKGDKGKKKEEGPSALERQKQQQEKMKMSVMLGFRGKPAASEGDQVKWRPGDLELAAPEELEEKLRAQYRSQFENASYGQLEELIKHLEYALKNQDSMTMQRYQAAGYGPGALRKLRKMLRDKMKDVKGRLYTDPVGQVAQDNELEGETVDDLYDWRKAKPPTGRKLSMPELREKFIREAKLDPGEAQKVRDMSIGEFQEMYIHILNADELEEEEDMFEEMMGKMGSAKKSDADTDIVDEVESKEDEEVPVKEDLGPPKNILEMKGGKTASYRQVYELMVRTAYHTKDPKTKMRLLRMIMAESKDPGDPSMDSEEEGEGEGYDPGEVLDNMETSEGPGEDSESELPGDDE